MYIYINKFILNKIFSLKLLNEILNVFIFTYILLLYIIIYKTN